MRIGFIFECPRGGPDQQVIEHLAKKIDPSVEIVNRFTNTNKPALVQMCGQQSAALLSQGCERVIIVWDLLPRWKDKHLKPYCKRDVAELRVALQEANVDEERVRLLCITAELETFLIADERALERVLTRPSRPANCPFKKNPHRLADPKSDLDGIFRVHGKIYSPLTDALKIARVISDFNRLKSIPSFKRLEKLVADTEFACTRQVQEQP
jgi:hypothetical protein